MIVEPSVAVMLMQGKLNKVKKDFEKQIVKMQVQTASEVEESKKKASNAEAASNELKNKLEIALIQLAHVKKVAEASDKQAA
jgi:chlorite dismutase